uniref:Uncharacterized protein n=1 Tax=Lutzomyia longipalpis TaxID=7200 RepID=A0A1B0C8R9_LUTLO
MQRHVPELPTGYNNLRPCGCNGFYLLLQETLLATTEVLQLIGGFNENRSLCFRLNDVHWAGEKCNLCITLTCNVTLNLSLENHPMKHFRALNATPENLANTYVVHIEGRLLGEDGNARLGNEFSQEVLIPVLFGHNCRPNCFTDLPKIPTILHFVTHEFRQNFQNLRQGLLVTLDNLTGGHTQPQKLFSFLQKCSHENNHEVSAVPCFSFLHLTCEYHQSCSWMLYIQFPDNCTRIGGHKLLFQMINHHLIHPIGPIG